MSNLLLPDFSSFGVETPSDSGSHIYGYTDDDGAPIKIRLRCPIEPIESWLTPYYLGPEHVWKFWNGHICNYFNSDYIRFIFYGSYSLGKTFIANIMLARQVYEIYCIENFLELFDLSPSTRIKMAFATMSLSKGKSPLGRLCSIFDNSPFFRNHCRRDQSIDSVCSFKDLGLDIYVASKLDHLTGEDLYGVIFDESNFVRAKQSQKFEVAKTLYTESQIRGAGRYSYQGVHMGFFGLLSSSDGSSSFAETTIAKSLEEDSAYVVQAAMYDVSPRKYSKVKQPVFIGLDDVKPHIIKEVAADTIAAVEKTYHCSYQQFLKDNTRQIIYVPEDLLRYFRDQIEYAIRAIAGRVIESSSKFIKAEKLLIDCYELNIGKVIVNPLLAEVCLGEHFMTLSAGSDDSVEQFIDPKIILDNYDGESNVYARYDLSKNDNHAGFSLVYRHRASGVFVNMFSASIAFRPGYDLDYYKMESLVYWLMGLGIYIHHVSMDSYNHIYISQNLEKNLGKASVSIFSVDRDDTAYLFMRFLMKKKLFKTYRYEPKHGEYRGLLYDASAHKIIHPFEGSSKADPSGLNFEGGAKDTCDAETGAVLDCFRGEGLSQEDVMWSAGMFLPKAEKEGPTLTKNEGDDPIYGAPQELSDLYGEESEEGVKDEGGYGRLYGSAGDEVDMELDRIRDLFKP